jgi:hypothetical protein
MAVNLRDELPERMRSTVPHQPAPATNMKGMFLLAIIAGIALLAVIAWAVSNFAGQQH